MIRKILIVSDSHGNRNPLDVVIKREQPDMLIHLGDVEADTEDIRRMLDRAAEERNKKLSASRTPDEAEQEERISLPVPAVFIRGNCDRGGGPELRDTAVFEVNGYRFFCTHGHRQGVSYGVENLAYSAMENGCGLALYGHTHIPFDEEWEGVRILNPGSISLPRGGSGKGYMIMSFDKRGEYAVDYRTV